jgi:hypothetical protein
MIAGTRQLEKESLNSPNGTSKTGQEDDGIQIQKCQDRIASQNCQYMITSVGLHGQDSSAGLPR